MKIDFVIPWVDGNDPAWQEERRKYKLDAGADASAARYRDVGLLKYWFRAVEAYAPWVNQIHFITWGHLPDWLNTDHPKLHVVNHKDYIPAEYLPTFSSHPIELNIHRIQGLSEHFVYFNDDMLLNGPVEPDFFFYKGVPCDFAIVDNISSEGADDVYSHIQFNESYLISKHYSYIKTFIKYPFKYVNASYAIKENLKNLLKVENSGYFPGFINHHLPSAYLKRTFMDFWEKDFETLDKVSKTKFRSPFDVSQSVMRYAQLASGQFHPVTKKSRGKCFQLWMEPSEMYNAILDEEIKMICLNDTSKDIDYDSVSKIILSAYEQKFLQHSLFECL